MPRRRPSLVLASILALPLAVTPAARAAAAPPAFTVEPLYDIEPTGAPWFFPVCPIPIPECPPGQGAYVRQMTTFGDLAVFTAFDFDHGEEVWVTDGTPQGTHPLIDLCPGDCWSLPRILGTVGGKLLFHAYGPPLSGGYRLWATDGLEVHAVGVEEIDPWVVSPKAIDGWLYFGHAYSVWRSDGVVLQLAAEFTGGVYIIEQILDLGSRAFILRDGRSGWLDELREIGPSTPEVLRACSPSDGFSRFVVLGDAAYFSARCVAGLPDLGPGLFRTDGSPGGTARVKTFDQGPPGYYFLPAAAEFFFLAASPGGVVIWRSDGTAAGTVPVSGPLAPPVRLLLLLGNRSLLFETTDHIRALDLTTGVVADLPIAYSAEAIAHPSGSFGLIGNSTGWWITSGTPETTFQVFTSDPQGWAPPLTAAFLRDRAVFSGDDGVHGEDIWVLGLPNALAIPALGWPGVVLLALLLAAAAVRALRR